MIALIASRNKINEINLAYAARLSFQVQKTYVGNQKIDSFSLNPYSSVIAAFQVFDKLGCLQFFQKMFLVANMSMKIIFGMLF